MLMLRFLQANAKEENADIPLVTTLHGTDITLVGQHPSYKHGRIFINHSDKITGF